MIEIAYELKNYCESHIRTDADLDDPKLFEKE
jgi:hypothetical protein